MELKKEVIGYIKIIIIGVIIAILLNKFIIINANITSESMLPTLEKADKLIGNRLAYTFSDPKRGDIIIFKNPNYEDELLVKRVIGLPTEVVTIKNGRVYIGDSQIPLDEPYVAETPIGDFGPFVVPAEHYFVLGDNRNNSNDSRFWEKKYVNKSLIVAKPLFKYYKKIKIVK